MRARRWQTIERARTRRAGCPQPKHTPWRGPARARPVCVALGIVLAVVGTVALSAGAAAQQADDEVRIVARKLANGKVEFGLQQRQDTDSWGTRLLPTKRFFPTTATVGAWLQSSPLTVDVDTPRSGEAGGVEVRIVARKLANGKLEFGLQQRQDTDSWGNRLLPTKRFFPTTATVGAWLQSSPLALMTTQPVPGIDTPPPTGTATGYTSVTAGDWHSCALHTDGTIDCWGRNAEGEGDSPEGTYIDVTAGRLHTCAIHTDGTITCWGSNTRSQTDLPDGL